LALRPLYTRINDPAVIQTCARDHCDLYRSGNGCVARCGGRCRLQHSMGRQRRTQQEIDQIRRERAQRKTQDVEVQMGAMTLEFHDNLRLTVEEDWHCENGDAIAGLQWAGGVRLARFFDDRNVFPPDYWKNKQVLELGAGQGLTSCLLSTLGCKRVVCSDADITHALQTVKSNADVLKAKPDVVAYSWGVGAPPIVADIVVCGDCLYNKDHAHLLVRGLLDCASQSTSVYLCGAVGEDAYQAFLAEAPRHFDVEVLDGSAQIGRKVDTWQKRDLLRLTKRSGPALQAIQPGRKDKLVGDDAALFDDVSDGDTLITSEDFTERARTLVDPHPDHKSVFVVDGVLGSEACQRLIAASSSRDSFWAGDEPHEDARPFRDADTCEVSCPKLAARIYERIAPYLSETPIAIPSTEHLEVRGEWRPCSLNEDFLFGNYPSQGGFAPHSDGATAKGLNLRSFYSVIIYLNTPSEGGGTRFYQSSATNVVLEDNRWTGRKDLAVFEVQPRTGRALVFDQRLVHEGIPPISDRKHIIRTDIMFERIEPLFVEFSAEYADYERAVDLSERGQHADAVRLFRKVSRTAPDLAAELGI
jgi:predicted nicotinamide N-methyase